MQVLMKTIVARAALAMFAVSLFPGISPSSMAAEENAISEQTDTVVEPFPNGDEFTLRVENFSDRPLVLAIDLHCTRGPDYRQGVDVGEVRLFTYSTNNSGSCFFERSTVRIGIVGVTPTQFHWESGFIPAGWRRGEADGPLPRGMQFFSSQDGFSTLIYKP